MVTYKNGGHHRMTPTKIILYRAYDKKLIDITKMVVSYTWSGDEETYPRKLDMSINNSTGNGRRMLNYGNGDVIYLYTGDREIFRGMIYSVTKDHRGNESFVCYDNLFYIVKSSTQVLYKNINASDIIIAELKAAGIPIGNIPRINYKITKKVFDNVSRESIIREVLLDVERALGKKYKLISDKGKVSLIERASTAALNVYLEYVISGSNTESIEDIVTQAIISKNGPDDEVFYAFKQTDFSLVEKYGYIQHVISSEDGKVAQMKKELSQYLKDNSKPSIEINIEAIGNFSCYTGMKIEVFDYSIQKKKIYYISSDSHTVSNGIHKMSLQLSTRLE